MKKTAKEEDIQYRIEQFNGEGEGVININLTRGCVSKKITATTIQITFKIENEESSMRSSQIVKTYMKVELLE